MSTYKLTIQYEGTRYQGWQKQTSTSNTIQGKFEAIFSKWFGEPIQVDGSGRTDAGVHAKGQVASVRLPKTLPGTERKDGSEQEAVSAERVMSYVNQYLPEDIAVIEVKEMPERFHARLNAKRKTYSYRIVNAPIPHVLERKTSLLVTQELDLEAMQAAAEKLLGTHDFHAYTSEKKSKKSTVRTIDSIEFLVDSSFDRVITILYHGDGFLYHMVRILTGTLLEVGLHKRSIESIEATLRESAVRGDTGELVPACGLCLESVEY